jgi:hypothetical protein
VRGAGWPSSLSRSPLSLLVNRWGSFTVRSNAHVPEVHEREKYASLTIVCVTCWLKMWFRYFIFSSELGTSVLWDWC